MLKASNMVFMGLIPLIDLLVECFYQILLVLSLNTKLSQYKNFSKLILKEKHLHHIEESIYHTLCHLSLHMGMAIVCVWLIAIALSSRLRSFVLCHISSILYLFPKFLNVTSFEIFLLEIQCVCVRCIESKWIWNLFVNESSILDYIWPVFVLLIWAPFEVRFKIFLEERFHHLAPIVLGITHGMACTTFPIAYFLAMKLVYHSVKSEINSSLILKKLGFYHFETASKHVKVLPISMPSDQFFLVQGHISDHSKGIYEFLQFEAFKFDGYASMYYLLQQFAKNLIFACLVIYFDKRFLKVFCSNDIHHICAHLLTEEYLNVGFSRYLFSPFTFVENYFINQHDMKIKENVGRDVSSLSNYFSFQLHNHKNIHPSLFYRLFNNETDTIERIDNILRK
ncbi:uncharacterized protein VICG_00686 [Vittaforma corneae ATCC 50505]|uniref:Uncharacterized protein n=1 Tax=Vittaforma corneae (strain ATCC 50505) TaxID=993615 RepID=L2GN78_VITCO|nr:uncharacterized protein VICG_00686 [Vittaforma corneae ATCC 50505]ELA42286.1 hypothetical protein VICG_00686 [Vittaforma corneae ATCC 50505]